MMAEQVERMVRALFPEESTWTVAVPSTCTDGASQVRLKSFISCGDASGLCHFAV